MMKKLALRLALLAAVVFSLQSCRTEEDLIQNPQETENRFQAFTSRNGEPVNYARGYKLLLEKYDSLYSTAYTSKTFFKNSMLGKSGSEEYVELNIRSQELMMKNNTERWILYPVVKGKEVIGIEVGILKNNESRLEFWRMDPQDAYYKEIIGSFRLAYSEKILTQQTMNKGGNCGRPGEEPCDTGEVVINIPRPNGPRANPNLYLPGANPGSGDPGVIGGNCGAYGNCGGGGGGYGENQNDPNNNDSCGKTKKQKSNPDYRAKINVLESNLDLKKETGFIEKNDGTFDYKDNATATEHANSLSLPDYTIYKDIKGFMHTHPNNFEDSEGNMRIGFKIFSPADVIYFNHMVKNAKDNGKPLDEVYAVMVSGSVTYQIRFTGNPDQIKTIYTNTKDQYDQMYLDYFQQNSKRSDDLNFLKFIDEVMNVRGITLVELNEDGVPPTMKTLNSNKDGVAKTECPQ